MIGKAVGGVLPKQGAFSDNDKAILALADAMLEQTRTAMATQQIQRCAECGLECREPKPTAISQGKRLWALAKTDPAKQATVLYVTAEVIRQIAILAQPFMPQSSAKMLDSLGVPQDERDFAALGTRIKAGATLPPPVGVFPRYVEPKSD